MKEKDERRMKPAKSAFGYVALGASLWGIIGYFVKELALIGFSPLQIVFLRAISALFFFLIWIMAYRPSLLKIRLKDTWYFIGTGILSVSFFNWCYFTTIQHSSIAIAAILLYTAPAFVLLISSVIFKERFTVQKVAALLLTLLGCTFVSGLFSDSVADLSLLAIATGLGAGFGYSLYSIFGKLAGRKYQTLTISFYTFLFATVLLFPLSGILSSDVELYNAKVITHTAGLGFFPTVLAYWFYTNGLKQLEASRAAIVSTIEPVVATIMGLIVYQEMISLLQMTGIILVLAAVLLIQEKKSTVLKSGNLDRSQ
jgi:drug/metabolite transporter (DMT)-like permease